MIHSYIRIPANTERSCWTRRAVPAGDLKAQLAYDKQWRWGQSLFVDGKCVHVGDGSGHSPEDIARLEREIGETPQPQPGDLSLTSLSTLRA